MKTILSLVLFLFMVCSANAQPFSGGFFAGMSASQVDGDTYSGYNKIGLTAGGYISSEFNRTWKWKAELRYIQKGATKRTSIENPDYYRLAIHYVEIPLMLQYYINERFFLEIGLAPDVYLYHNEEDEFGDIPADEGPDYHRFGLNGGAGIGYFISDNIVIGIRNSYSIIPMRDHASEQTYLLNRGQYNNVLGISLYYHFE
jgi:opacity protein-like surface antigen